MVRFILLWVAEKMVENARVSYGLRQTHMGELYRADAKAEGDLIVIGGWEVGGDGDPKRARWYSLQLGREDIPWAYVRGDPFRSISALELLATLVSVMVFNPRDRCGAAGLISLTMGGDNQSHGFTLDRMASTKYPLYLVLMELSEQMRARDLLLSVAWRPRDENEEADALTNGDFGGFDPSRRVQVVWKDLELLVLPRLTRAAEEHFRTVQAAKDAAKKRPAEARGGGRGGARAGRGRTFREREPW